MSRILDILERVEHGSAAGYVGGCRSRGGCPNHGSRTHLTCPEAYRAHRGLIALAELPENTIITRAMRRDARNRPFDPAERTHGAPTQT